MTVALCALTAIRVYDGTDVSNDIGLQGSDAFGLSLQCYAAVVNAMPADITMIADYCQAMKANALLASVCLQTGDLAKTVAHMGIYSGLSAIHKFHLEAHWGVLLNEIQREERRRLVSLLLLNSEIDEALCHRRRLRRVRRRSNTY